MPSIRKPSELKKMRVAGLIVAEAMAGAQRIIKVGTRASELYDYLDAFPRKFGARPSLVNHKHNGKTYGRPACLSLNEVTLHGVLDGDHELAEQDILTVDYVVEFDGWHADAAVTFPVDNPTSSRRRLIFHTYTALQKGIGAVKHDAMSNYVGQYVSTYVENCAPNHKVELQYGGHGIGQKMHELPFIPNTPDKSGVKLVAGNTVCVEPILLERDASNLKLQLDGWSLASTGGEGAHFEHTLLVTEDRPEILTPWHETVNLQRILW